MGRLSDRRQRPCLLLRCPREVGILVFFTIILILRRQPVAAMCSPPTYCTSRKTFNNKQLIDFLTSKGIKDEGDWLANEICDCDTTTEPAF